MYHNYLLNAQVVLRYGAGEIRDPPDCKAFCDCVFPTKLTTLYHMGHIPDLVKCRCGEDDPATHTLHWNWNQSFVEDAMIKGPDITFHPTYSRGTGIIRGETPLAAGMLHFWEMRMLTTLSGTDVMFGIGTEQMDLTQFTHNFASALGTNSHSWGLSYEGKIRHNGMRSSYGRKFSQGCVVGVLLDRVRGQLEFFLNRRSLGVAFTNIPNDPRIKIYPMVCSTSAKSCIRLMNAISQLDSLQLRAFRALVNQPKALEELKKMPGIKPVLKNYWFLVPGVGYSQESKSDQHDMLDEAVLPSKPRLSRKHKLNDDDSDDSDDNDDNDDLDSNAQKIPTHRNLYFPYISF